MDELPPGWVRLGLDVYKKSTKKKRGFAFGSVDDAELWKGPGSCWTLYVRGPDKWLSTSFDTAEAAIMAYELLYG